MSNTNQFDNIPTKMLLAEVECRKEIARKRYSEIAMKTGLPGFTVFLGWSTIVAVLFMYFLGIFLVAQSGSVSGETQDIMFALIFFITLLCICGWAYAAWLRRKTNRLFVEAYGHHKLELGI